MKVELKPILDQLSEVIELPDDYKVSAVFDDNGNKLVAWTIVKVEEDGTLEPCSGTYPTIKDLLAINHQIIRKKHLIYEINS